MSSTPYIERLIHEFNGRNPDYVGAHDAHLASILEAVDGLPSPEKEERLVELILEGDELAGCSEPSRPATRTATGREASGASHP